MANECESQEDIKTKFCCFCSISLHGWHTYSWKETAFWNVTSCLMEALRLFPAGKKTFINFYLHPLQETLAFSHHHKHLKSHTLSSSLTTITHLWILHKAECHGDYESLNGRRFKGRGRGIFESILEYSYGKYVR